MHDMRPAAATTTGLTTTTPTSSAIAATTSAAAACDTARFTRTRAGSVTPAGADATATSL